MKKIDKSVNRTAQTLFRTLSKNNYVLQEMIDRKANIIITTNAIIISVLLGSTFCQDVAMKVHPVFLLVLLGIWVLSIMLALFAIKPFLLSPKKMEWSDKLLNYHYVKDADFTTYKNKVFKILTNEIDIFESMIEDIYQVGKNIKRKHYYLDFAALTFVVGIIMSAIIYGYSIF